LNASGSSQPDLHIGPGPRIAAFYVFSSLPTPAAVSYKGAAAVLALSEFRGIHLPAEGADAAFAGMGRLSVLPSMIPVLLKMRVGALVGRSDIAMICWLTSLELLYS